MEKTYKNPVLPGFNPDPSICNIGDDYCIVNSSFEWFSGIPIYHSKDITNWTLIGHGTHRKKQVVFQEELRGYKRIFAVTIRDHNGLFYPITTCVDCETGGDFYVSSENPARPWSGPIWLDAPGINLL